jgi:glucokinase
VILAGDVGGTKVVLAICDAELAIRRQDVFPCADYPSLEAVLDAFLLPADRATLTAACFGVAGPVVAGTAKITNLTWTIDAARVAAVLGGIPVTLLNDLQATALGALVLPDMTFAVLQPAAARAPDATIAVIAPGTGLGEALLVSDGARYRALPSEGGHADFAPGTDEEIELLRYLHTRHGDHVSYERVLSGAGIGELYDFVRTATGAPEPAWLIAALAAHAPATPVPAAPSHPATSHADRNALISQAALDGTDPQCVRALDMFVEILGAEAGNLALRGLATGGVVIGGGIPPKILAALQHRRFLDRFNAKGRFASWTRGLAVRVALEPRAALFGAADHAVHLAATHKDSRS